MTASSPRGEESPTKLTDLEERSKQNAAINVNLRDDEAMQISLITLIARMEWRHTMNKIEANPKEARTRQTLKLEGHETKGYALHLAVSKKPPVRLDYTETIVVRDLRDKQTNDRWRDRCCRFI